MSSRVSSRMLWTEYPQEPATFAIDDEFLIGESQMPFFPSLTSLKAPLSKAFFFPRLKKEKVVLSVCFQD